MLTGEGVLMGLLGPFRLRTDDLRPVDVGGPRVRMLLARLALEPNRTVPTEVLIEELWDGSRPSAALNALQSLISRARRALPPDGGFTLETTGAGYVLTAPDDVIDVHRFEWLAAQGRGQLRADEADRAARTLRAALQLWRGGALVDFAGYRFAEVCAFRLDELRLAALEDRIDADLRTGNPAGLVAELDSLTARHPLRERFTALHVRALHADGRQADAVAAYDGFRRRLADEQGLDPSPELRELHLAVLRGGSDRAPERSAPTAQCPTRAEPDRPAKQLPVRLSSFVGRTGEIAQVTRALRESRLVTLFGSGGAGKTRLATESAAGIETRVLFVELAPVRDSHDLASAALAAMGVREGRLLEMQPAATRAMARLVDALSSEPTLLVLDNCEHVISAAAGLVGDLLAQCPDLRVLATSREPLALTGEQLLPVGPLELPDRPDAGRPEAGYPERATDAAAVRLFAERAAAVRPGFVLDEDSVGDVVEICRRLDGLPLAIELAAARLRAMSLRQIADRLDDRFRLLTSGNRASMPRHRTLRAVVEWSWELLSESERSLARRFSVFTGAVHADSVAAVCAPDDPAGADVVYVLSSLVEKSLVEAVDGNGARRYRMLETVRAYCSERLEEAGEQNGTRTGHAAHFLELAEIGARRIHTGEQLDWLERLDVEHDNILSALHFSTASGDADRGLRFVAALGWYWSMSAQHTEVLGRMAEALAVPGDAPPASRAIVELMHGFFADEQEWSHRLRRAAARVRDTAAMDRYLHAALLEPMAWMLTGELDEMDASVRRARAHPQPWVNAAGLYARAAGSEHRGDLAGGERYADQAVREFSELGDRWGFAQAIGLLAGFRSLRGDHAGAIEVLEESVASLRRLRSVEDLVPQLARIGVERVRAGDLDGARRDLQEAAELTKTSFPYHRITVSCGLAEESRAAGDHDQAREHLRRAHETMREPGMVPSPMQQVVLASEARLLIDRGREDPTSLEEARESLAGAVETGRGIGDMPLSAMLADQAARWLSACGESERAAWMLGASTAMRGVADEGDPDIRALRGELTTALGPTLFARAFDAGAAVTVSEAHAELARVLRR